MKNLFQIINLHQLLKNEFREEYSLGAVRSRPNFRSLLAVLVGMRHNLNNLGNVYALKNLDLSRKIEKEVIEWSKQLINCADSTIEGYVSSGGTESNLFLMWAGREWLKKFSLTNSILIKTAFTHYSISKAGKILGLEEVVVSINESYWGIDIKDLEKIFRQLFNKKHQTFLLPITLGYSSTGAMDQLNNLLKLITKLQHQLQIKCFVWVDAAMQGLPLAYLNKNFSPMENSLIQGLVIDPHKLGLTPVPSGIVLYRSSLRKLVQQPIDYLQEVDATLSGSRPGFSVLAIWASLVNFSQEYWKKRFSYLNQRKIGWMKELKTVFPNVTIITATNSLTIGLVIDKNFPALPLKIAGKYGLHLSKVRYVESLSGKEKTLKHYKIFFLSHIQRHDEFLRDLKNFKKRTG